MLKSFVETKIFFKKRKKETKIFKTKPKNFFWFLSSMKFPNKTIVDLLWFEFVKWIMSNCLRILQEWRKNNIVEWSNHHWKNAKEMQQFCTGICKPIKMPLTFLIRRFWYSSCKRSRKHEGGKSTVNKNTKYYEIGVKFELAIHRNKLIFHILWINVSLATSDGQKKRRRRRIILPFSI